MLTASSTVEINASPERVWAILTDLPGHASWDLFITAISGSLMPGQKLNVTIKPPGGKPVSFKPTVTSVVENRELAWLGRFITPGLFDGAHRFTLEPTQSGTKLQQSESFSGLLVGFSRGLLQHTQQGFEQFNAALKRRAEESPAADQQEQLWTLFQVDQQRISALDTIAMTIRGWTVTLVSAIVAFALAQHHRNLLPVAIVSTVLLMLLDVRYRSVQLRHVDRAGKVEEVIIPEYRLRPRDPRGPRWLNSIRSRIGWDRYGSSMSFYVVALILLLLLWKNTK